MKLKMHPKQVKFDQKVTIYGQAILDKLFRVDRKTKINLVDYWG